MDLARFSGVATSVLLVLAATEARAVDASDVVVTPSGRIQSADVQAALEEIDAGRDHDLVYAEDYDTPLSTTGGVSEAIRACGLGPVSGRCIIVLPPGVVEVSNLVIGGMSDAATKSGLVILGHGSGNEPSSCGTVLRHVGGGATALALLGVRHSVFRDFCIDAQGAANGILIEAGTGNAIVTQNRIENVAIHYQSGPGIMIGRPTDLQVDEMVFESIAINGGTHCVKVYSDNAWSVFSNLHCRNYTEYGVEVTDGSVTVANSTFLTSPALPSTSAIMIRDEANQVHLRENHFELESGQGILTYGNTRSYVTEILGNTMGLGSFTGADALNFGHAGALSVIGNTFGVRNGARGVDFRIANTGPSVLRAIIQANHVATDIGGAIAVSPRMLQQGGYGPLRIANGANAGAACVASAAGRLYHDTDCDDVRDPGEPYLDGRSDSQEFGPAQWASAGTTGTAACANAGFLCVDAYPVGSSSQAACSSTASVRMVRCR